MGVASLDNKIYVFGGKNSDTLLLMLLEEAQTPMQPRQFGRWEILT
ncbi:MAG: hypothetical protein IPI12_01160 [Ignavibacteriales bacterium]|nr:hypothetical protein [Ignavibacteriales bacterium]